MALDYSSLRIARYEIAVKFLFERIENYFHAKIYPEYNVLYNKSENRSFAYFFCLKILPTRHEKASISSSSSEQLFRNLIAEKKNEWMHL